MDEAFWKRLILHFDKVDFEDKDDTIHKKIYSLSGIFVLAEKVVMDNQEHQALVLNSNNKNKMLFLDSEAELLIWLKLLKKATNYIDLNDYYEIGEVIGEGRFGLVKEGKRKTDKKKVAIKIYDKHEMCSNDMLMIKTEVDILKICQHQYIVQLIDNFENDSYIYISKGINKLWSSAKVGICLIIWNRKISK